MDEKGRLMISHSKPTLTNQDNDAVSTILKSGNIANGIAVQNFEQMFKQYTAVQHARFVNSGSKAILLALQIMQIGKGDEVILPTYLCHSVFEAVIQSGASPVLCDVSDNWNVDIIDIEKVFSSKTKCIIIVHTMGIAVDIDKFKCFGVPIIEDCCQALGAKNSKGEHVGILGDFSIFSFHAIKCITTGEGGMLCINNKNYSFKIDQFQNNKSISSSMTDIHATLGISQLEQYNFFLNSRKKIAQNYFSGIEQKELIAQFKSVYNRTNFFRFLITSDCDFFDIKEHFLNKKIAIRKGVDELLHKTFPDFFKGDFENAEAIFKRTISIPIYPFLSLPEQTLIIDTINTYEKFR
jgi:perosamine synthetase